jgi:Ser/Thr protein kinase RdoA (MazF antagonist)
VKGELDVKRELDLLLFLRKHGFPCPQPIADREGAALSRVGGKCLSIYRWIDGHVPNPSRFHAAQLEAVGRVLADLHTIGKSYKKGIDNRFTFERIADAYGEVRGSCLRTSSASSARSTTRSTTCGVTSSRSSRRESFTATFSTTTCW